VPETLFELPPDAPPKQAPHRITSKGIAPGDVVEIDKKGRHFHALVKEIHQDPKGYYHLDLQPFDRRVSYHHATVREVTGVWRRVRTGPAATPGA
jgi:hypothetical protein